MALTHPGRRERIIAKCLVGTPFAGHAEELNSFSQTLHEARWGATAAFCAAAMRPMGILRRCWSAEAYTEKGVGEYLEREWGAEGVRFKPNEFTRVVKSGLFRNYHLTIVKLKAIPTRLMAWFDGRPCHEHVLMGATTQAYKQRALREDGGLLMAT